jgi:hypothetical protein
MNMKSNDEYRERSSQNNRHGELASESLKAGGRTYFFDIKEAKSGRPYLTVTETRLDKKSGQRERSSLIFYPEIIRDFHKTFQHMARQLIQFNEELKNRPEQQSIDDEL